MQAKPSQSNETHMYTNEEQHLAIAAVCMEGNDATRKSRWFGLVW